MSFTPSCWNCWTDLIVALSAITASGVAVAGFFTWRNQFRRKEQHSLSREIVRATYDLLNELRNVRNPQPAFKNGASWVNSLNKPELTLDEIIARGNILDEKSSTFFKLIPEADFFISEEISIQMGAITIILNDYRENTSKGMSLMKDGKGNQKEMIDFVDFMYLNEDNPNHFDLRITKEFTDLLGALHKWVAI